MKRIAGIDITRGVVMIIMALDHVRDFVHVSALSQNPTDLGSTTPLLFFTRWITHLCAPTFVFLAGTSAYLYFRKVGKHEARSFLFKRGAWLIIADFTIVGFALWLDIQFRTMMFEVIAAIGFGFLILGLLINAPSRTLGIIGLIIVFAHGLLALIPFTDGSVIRLILGPLFSPSSFQWGGTTVVVGYPPIPWLGIMLIGFSSGEIFEQSEELRKKLLLKLGLISLALFCIIRFINLYGDFPWSPQERPLFTILSFINVTKYPPSLLFVLLMLGLMFFILWVSEGAKGKWASIAVVYGRVPFFYFVVHLYLAHLTMLALMFIQGFHWHDLNFGPFGFGRPAATNGVEIATVYLIWMAVVAAMYPLCRWYGNYKENHKEITWLKYL